MGLKCSARQGKDGLKGETFLGGDLWKSQRELSGEWGRDGRPWTETLNKHKPRRQRRVFWQKEQQVQGQGVERSLEYEVREDRLRSVSCCATAREPGTVLVRRPDRKLQCLCSPSGSFLDFPSSLQPQERLLRCQREGIS